MITEFPRQPFAVPSPPIAAGQAAPQTTPALPVLGALPQPARAGASGAADPSIRRPAPATGLRDLSFASALAAAAERLLDAPSASDLWARVVSEAVALIPADAAALIEYRERSWRLLATRPSDAGTGAAASDHDVAAMALDGLLDATAGVTEPLTLPSSNGTSWPALLIGRLTGLSRRNRLRLVWLARSPAVLPVTTGMAAIFLRHVDAALQSVHARDTLQRAAAARHHIGLAQGVLMSRHQWTAEQAFARLQQRSQDTNVKLRLVADQVIAEGDLSDQSTAPIHRTRIRAEERAQRGGTP